MADAASNNSNLTNLPPGIFLVREQESRASGRLTAHAFDGFGAKRELAAQMPAGRLSLAVHHPRRLASATSLAALNRRFGGGAIVYDPTAIFTRASELVRCAGMIRAALGRKAGKILFDSVRRTLYIVLEGAGFEGEGIVFRAEVAEAMVIAAKTVSAWKENAPADFEFAIRVGFEPPSGSRLVAVDEKSRPSRLATRLSSVASRLRRVAGVAAVGAVAAAAPSLAFAGDDTAAVSMPNFTLLGQGEYDSGLISHHDLTRADGGAEAAFPLSQSVGAQIEAGAGSDSYYGVGGHLFWRDPSWGLLGAFGSDESLSSIKMQRYGGEAEFYLNDVTLSGQLGEQSGDVRSGAFGKFDVAFYATPSFVLRAGLEASSHVGFGHAGFEFQPAAESMPGLSLYVDGSTGEGSRILAGLKFHFGEEGETLMYRDRHDDPLLAIFNEIPLLLAHKKHYGPRP